MNKPLSFFEQVRNECIEKGYDHCNECDIYKGNNYREGGARTKKLPNYSMWHMVAKLYEFQTDDLCNIEKQVGKKKRDEKNGKKRFEEIYPEKEKS